VTDEIQVFLALEYWLKLRVPMEQAIRHYKERVKALGYLNTSIRDSQTSSGPVLSSSSLMDGMFELTDHEGLPSGQISVTLKWTFTYLPPGSSSITTQQIEITGRATLERQTSQDKEKTETQTMTKDPPLIPQPTVSEMEQTTASDNEKSSSSVTPAPKTVIVMEAGEATAVSEEEDEEESQFSEGQVITASSQSDESEISELQQPPTVVDVQDSSEVIGHLVVTVEALEALTSIIKDPERDHSLTPLA
ncbi:hypothetical protein cypCar_00039811, partial [Cyprinus carpio]